MRFNDYLFKIKSDIKFKPKYVNDRVKTTFDVSASCYATLEFNNIFCRRMTNA